MQDVNGRRALARLLPRVRKAHAWVFPAGSSPAGSNAEQIGGSVAKARGESDGGTVAVMQGWLITGRLHAAGSNPAAPYSCGDKRHTDSIIRQR